MESFLTQSQSSGPSGQSTMPPGILGYRARADCADEMLTPTGEIKPHWKTFASFLAQCSSADIQARGEAVQSLLRDHGMTYNIYDDALGTSRPWELDFIPVIVAADEARRVAEGLDQRSRLLEAIVADIYGPQTLIKEGRLPPSIIAASPHFLRPIVGIAPPGKRFLHNLGCDLVRGSDGHWHALADRVTVPFGEGYTLENRIIMSRVFAEEFNASRVQRLAHYFETERETLRSLAPKRRGAASIAMFTPGPRDEGYFEQAFKARYLGFPLVECADLTVRDRRVHLKTLEGLRRIDVLIRRHDDLSCDPLELGSDASQGVPGLVEAWRSGSLALANGLGTGVVGTPALHPFLPGLCRHLLGEELKIPCVPTWWCGQQRELNMILSNPERWVLKEAFVRGKRSPIFLNELDATARAAALEAVKAQPHLWIAQERLALSTTPTWVKDHLEPRPLVWRTYMISDGDGYMMLPGGLSRVSSQSGSWVVTMRSGGISKDTWVLSDGPVVRKTLLHTQPIVIKPARPPSEVPSRVADHLFWLGRYAERLEQIVRVVRASFSRLSGENVSVQTRELQGCMDLMIGMRWMSQDAAAAQIRDTLQDIIRNPSREDGLPQLISSLRYNASAARDRLSDDTWRLFNRIERDVRQLPSIVNVTAILAMLDTIVLDLAAFSGMQTENMTHGHGWRFMELGRRIERARIIAAFVKAGTVAAQADEAVLVSTLEICDSTMTYRRLHFAAPRLVQTAYLLLQDPANPRSVAYQVDRLLDHAKLLPRGPAPSVEPTTLQRIQSMAETLRAPDLPNWWATPEKAHAQLPETCETLVAALEQLSNAITEHYFSHAARRVR